MAEIARTAAYNLFQHRSAPTSRDAGRVGAAEPISFLPVVQTFLRRIERAKQLLANRELSAIALDPGFSETSTFIAHFTG
jgi:hypothetical protein